MQLRICVLTIALFLLFVPIACGGGNGENDLPPESEATPPPTNSQYGQDDETRYQRNGVTDDSVLFGQSAAFSGPAWELGTNMQLGIQIAFDEVNQAGGVHGRELKLESLDDRYEPEEAIDNTFELIDENKVFGLIGAVGTPTSRSAVPIAADTNVPYIAPFSGADFLREAKWRNVVNMRASYSQETEEVVARLTEDLRINRIGVLYQDDSFGRAGLLAITRALEKRSMQTVSVGFYPRNTLAVKKALLDLRRGNPEAIIMVGTYQPVATLVVWARRTGMDPVFVTTSFTGSNALAQFLGPDGRDVIVSQVVPFPTDSSIPIVNSYLNALREFKPDATPGWISLEGYIAGRLAQHGLEKCGRDLTRECFLDTLREAETIELEGFNLHYGFADNQGSDSVFLTVIGPDGQHRPIENLQEVFP